MAKKIDNFAHNPEMRMVISYLSLFLTNVIVLWLAVRWFPQYIVLGTIGLTVTWALCLSMGKLALIDAFALPFFHEWEKQRGKKMSNVNWLVGYFLINFAGIWIITRFAEVFGLGITSWMVAGWLALVLSLVQGLMMTRLKKWLAN
ncbi:MAG: hypothetical protein A2383_02230 [Candidatus Pacebacteria bacterium RIFOXYB1_FULL_39_46]|nr:MAG: hypothetical protein A2383_02230 [Candidatus Pacebacteria bacterium RIFOXYB1_FULL_39_46]OGJ39117.1 MAG: hypothetical protein A2182_02220 [Candidatus Pacebacteria bacterium RIFOXYA1_FULL_38_18]OGJ40183.1 MAG: hypothetical protein A2582_03785 [Candidatus Pacebacteria bacterium RIFOXYD1_FULL_39_27]OGJ41066.1 MAG: hypothetical protein A2411_01130 [Candidatus Pacebacteria bacterium RIFOXYC1_FULL_39_21]